MGEEDEERKKKHVKNVPLIFKFQFWFPLLFGDGGQFIR